MNAGVINNWIEHPELLNRDTLYELRTLLGRYPWFQTARLLYLKNLYLLHDPGFGDELRKAALYVANRSVLFQLLEANQSSALAAIPKESSASSVLEEPGLDRTLALIDAFLQTIPQETPLPTDLDYTADYTHYLLQEEESAAEENVQKEEVKLRGADLIDQFIEKNKEEYSLKATLEEEEETVGNSTEIVPVINENEEDDSYFTETLAKIYVKQQRYSKALEIIKKLSLKYPKKNAYFADQIRFLEKLIINAKSK